MVKLGAAAGFSDTGAQSHHCWRKKLAAMARAYSLDLRERVVRVLGNCLFPKAVERRIEAT
jgi:hypothetical protein